MTREKMTLRRDDDNLGLFELVQIDLGSAYWQVTTNRGPFDYF